jgi:3-dehydroquinate dehydratase/shikimate dehydrogenase
MKRYGLIGHPIAGSLSPRLFEAAYGGRYAYDLLEGADFGVSWQRFLDGYHGINITAPFKQDAFRAVDVLSDNARLCGAVNLAVKTPDGIVGHNTDVDGVVLAVREAGLPVSEALVVGCGGAGRAAAVAAFRLGCRVTLANRTPSRAAALASELGCDWIPVDDLPALDPDLVIYTVPGPMEGLPEFRNAIILEANYRTPCLEGCGRAYVSGLRWLLYQAVAGYGIFTGETPDTDAMFRIFC